MKENTQIAIGTGLALLATTYTAYSATHWIAFHQFGHHAKKTINLLNANQPLGDAFVDIPNTRAIRSIQGWSPSWKLALKLINDKTTHAYGNRTVEYWQETRNILRLGKARFIFDGALSLVATVLSIRLLISKLSQRVDTKI